MKKKLKDQDGVSGPDEEIDILQEDEEFELSQMMSRLSSTGKKS